MTGTHFVPTVNGGRVRIDSIVNVLPAEEATDRTWEVPIVISTGVGGVSPIGPFATLKEADRFVDAYFPKAELP